MLRVIWLLFAAICTALVSSTGSAQEFEPCNPIQCVLEEPPKPSCRMKIFPGISVDDPACIARYQVLVMEAKARHQNCMSRAAFEKARCESLRAAKDDTSALLTDGVECNRATDCMSGYCLPGPSLRPATSRTRVSPDEPWYCVDASANCALPETGGGFYGAPILFQGKNLICQDPGKGLWAQYLPGEVVVFYGCLGDNCQAQYSDSEFTRSSIWFSANSTRANQAFAEEICAQYGDSLVSATGTRLLTSPGGPTGYGFVEIKCTISDT